MNDLHRALLAGAHRRAKALVEGGTIDINQCDGKGGTPLIYAAMRGHSCLVDMLLERGADTTSVNETGFDALHASSMNGDAATALALVRAGADLETVEKSMGATSLHMASQEGNHEVVEVLVEAGERVNRRASDGGTPLYIAATRGQALVVSVLLRAKANPLLRSSGFTPLEAAAKLEYPDVVRTMILQVGIGVCGGSTRGEISLTYAAQQRNFEIVKILTEGGAVDVNGQALCAAVDFGHEESVRFLLSQRRVVGALLHYVNFARDHESRSPIQCCLMATSLSPFSCRIVRRLMEAGAELHTEFLFGKAINSKTEFRDAYLRRAIDASESQLHGLEGVRRLILQEKAARAVSWGWPCVSTSRAGAASKRTLTVVLRRPSVPSVLRKAMERYTVKLDGAFLGYGAEG